MGAYQSCRWRQTFENICVGSIVVVVLLLISVGSKQSVKPSVCLAMMKATSLGYSLVNLKPKSGRVQLLYFNSFQHSQ